MSSLTHLDASNSFTILRTEGRIKVLCTSMDYCLTHSKTVFLSFHFSAAKHGDLLVYCSVGHNYGF